MSIHKIGQFALVMIILVSAILGFTQANVDHIAELPGTTNFHTVVSDFSIPTLLACTGCSTGGGGPW